MLKLNFKFLVVQATLAAAIMLPASSMLLAATRVAFLEVRDGKGQLVQLEPGFPYAHMAISINDSWLHAHPASGVELANDERMTRYGRIAEIIDVPDDFELRDDLIQDFVGQPYDRDFSWNNNALYCSELVAKILGISPVPMVFDPHFWPRDYSRLNGKPGISPGIVYRKLLRHHGPFTQPPAAGWTENQ